VLVLNVGSSSIKFALYGAGQLDVICRGGIEGIGRGAKFKVTGTQAQLLIAAGQPSADDGHAALTTWLLEAIRRRHADVRIYAAGHRVVHGGQTFVDPVVVETTTIEEIERLTPLAPDHEPYNLAGINAVSEVWKGIPQVACFDTAFHRTQPRVAQLFALPRGLTDAGILRYGFHGVSYEYIAGVLVEFAGKRAEGRVIVAHLGSGASLCAMRGRQSIATSMGLTALDGLMMGTRCGSLDPGVVLHLLQQKGLSPDQVKTLLYQQSGLLGVSELSADVRDLESNPDPRAAEALELFAYRANCELGAMVAALGGLDVLVFTAGIGEHSASIRQRICNDGRWAGIHLDVEANNDGARRISSGKSAVDVYVVPTDEEIVIARATRRLLGSEYSPRRSVDG
jgi:acetate kinase